MTQSALAVINCSQLVTVCGPERPRIGPEMRELSIIRDGVMLVRKGLVEQIGERQELEPSINGSYQIVDAGGRVVLPGFVDAHAHPVFAGSRANEFEKRAEGKTYQEIAAAGGGIRASVRATRAASGDDLFSTALKRQRWFVRSGTTTVEAKSGYGLSVEDELKILRVIQRLNESGEGPEYIPTFLGAHEVPDEYRSRRDEYVDLVVNEMLPRVVAQGLAEFCDVFCEDRVFTLEESRRILTTAARLGLKLRVHADQLSLSGGAQLAAELGAMTADHLEHVDHAGIAALQRRGVQPVLLPGSVYALGSTRYPPVRAMIDAGLGVVLATDFNPGSSPTPSMTMVLSIAATQMKMTPAEAVTATTINAAYSLDRGLDRGSLEIGKRADFVVHDCADYRELGYYFGVEHAHAVYRSGQRIYLRNDQLVPTP